MTSQLPPANSAALQSARRTFDLETQALKALALAFETTPLRDAFERAVATIVGLPGRVVVTGMGKSGLIARKIVATLASTGTPALFLHPADASHGDLGVITRNDAVLALSWSGETSELSDVVTYCRRFGIILAAITSRANSSLGQRADICMTLPIVQEACPHNLAPTSSTTMQAVLGDAIAVAAIEARGFSPSDFQVLHPKGQLGARLVTLGDLMSRDDDLPAVGIEASIGDAIMEMSAKRFGITAVVDGQRRLVGSFTDGDLRRSLAWGQPDRAVKDHMSRNPFAMPLDSLASEALALMNARAISQVFVCREGRLIGIVHFHDIVRVGVV